MMAAVQKVMDHYGRIDILVCGAAGNFLAPVESLSYRAFKTVIEIDLLGTFNTIKACLDPLKASKGCVINISATLQYTGIPLQVGFHIASP
jgi:peroxisomal 2,4-dienoyl-CoA reductase